MTAPTVIDAAFEAEAAATAKAMQEGRVVDIGTARKQRGGKKRKQQARQQHPDNPDPGLPPLEIGDDAEIAERVIADLEEERGRLVCAEGELWQYDATQWTPLAPADVWRAIRRYSGAAFNTPAGEPSVVKMNRAHAESIAWIMRQDRACNDFFARAPAGINCASGLIVFARNGTPSLEPHSREHRQRHTLPGRWQPGANPSPPAISLLSTLLTGCFAGDADAQQKIDLLAEVGAAAALGMATRLRNPLAVILHGQSAENGKSQVQSALEALLPPSAVCSVSAAEMGDERHIVGLAGKMLNIVGELSSAAIASEKFKAVVTGDLVSGRDVYKSRAEFRPVAQHVFAANTLPSFKGGMDRGVRRRLCVLTFNRTIPREERIEDIGRRIGEEEADYLLAWVVAGAQRLVNAGKFTVPPSSAEALRVWISAADPVLGWIEERVEAVAVEPDAYGRPHPRCRTRDAYAAFRAWAIEEGCAPHSVPAAKGFTERMLAAVPGVQYWREPGTRQRHLLGLQWRS